MQLDEVSPAEIIWFLIPVTQDFEYFFWLEVVTSCQCHKLASSAGLTPDRRTENCSDPREGGPWLTGHRFLPRKVLLMFVGTRRSQELNRFHHLEDNWTVWQSWSCGALWWSVFTTVVTAVVTSHTNFFPECYETAERVFTLKGWNWILKYSRL